MVTPRFKKELRIAAAAEGKNMSDFVRDILTERVSLPSFFSQGVSSEKQSVSSQETDAGPSRAKRPAKRAAGGICRYIGCAKPATEGTFCEAHALRPHPVN
jgi:plasmid stability protein